MALAAYQIPKHCTVICNSQAFTTLEVITVAAIVPFVCDDRKVNSRNTPFTLQSSPSGDAAKLSQVQSGWSHWNECVGCVCCWSGCSLRLHFSFGWSGYISTGLFPLSCKRYKSPPLSCTEFCRKAVTSSWFLLGHEFTSWSVNDTLYQIILLSKALHQFSSLVIVSSGWPVLKSTS